MTLLCIEGSIYDVSKYVNKHPGEGISGVYLRQYKNKNCTKDFDKFHITNDAFEILEKAKLGDSCSGVRYVCPMFFERKIPKYFYTNMDDPYATSKIDT